MTYLPIGWVETTLGEIGTWSSGGTPSRKVPSYYGGAIQWVKTGDLNDDYLERAEETITEEGLAHSSAKLFPVGTLLLAMYGATIGRTAILSTEAATNQACAALLPESYTSDLIPFVWWYLRANVEEFKVIGQGGAQPNISQALIKRFKLCLPPLPEQHRIVAKLDALFARTRQAREELERIPALIEHYKQAILAAAFRGELTADWRSENDVANDAWGMVCIGEIITDIRYGTAKKCGYEPSGTPVLRIPNVGENGIDITDLKYTELTESEIEKLALKAGDLLVVRSNGSVDLVGRVALVGEDIEGFAYAGYLIRLRPNSDKVAPGFLRWMLTAPQTRRTIEVNARSTSGVHNVNSQELQELVVPLTSIDEQLEIVQRIEDAMDWLDIVLGEATSALRLLDHLDQATLAKAFRGELVPQDPDDEPASVLLERIRAARAEQSNGSRRQKRK